MLGENHSLLCDFPALSSEIHSLTTRDKAFAEKALEYHRLDTEIRELELKSSPIDDATMHQKKHQRAELKDELYQRLVKEKS